MIGVGLLFIFVAGVAFLGFIIGALFNRIRITKILPLMLIGLLAGPILHLINTGPGSTIANLVPVVSSIAIAFILFDVGLNMNIFRLEKVIGKATLFTFAVSIATGLVLAVAAYAVFGWSPAEALLFGFALSGTSSIVVPTLMKSLKLSTELNDTLIYESIANDTTSLVVPLLMLQFMLASSNVTVSSAVSLFVVSVFGAALLGLVLAIFWLYLLKSFKDFSREYGWVLTITMVLATYGIAQQLNLSAAIAIFTFSIAFANLGMITLKVEKPSDTLETFSIRSAASTFVMQRLHIGNGVRNIRDYQKGVEFFTSTFFFVYVGLLFSTTGLSTILMAVAILLVILIVSLRMLFLPVLRAYLPKDPPAMKAAEKIVLFNMPRGLAAVVVATLPLAAKIVIPNFLNEIFLVVLFTNAASTIGVFLFYKPAKKPIPGTANEKAAPGQ